MCGSSFLHEEGTPARLLSGLAAAFSAGLHTPPRVRRLPLVRVTCGHTSVCRLTPAAQARAVFSRGGWTGLFGPALADWARSEEFSEPIDREAGIEHDPSHRGCVHRVVARNRGRSRPVGHDDVLTLSRDAEARLLQRPYGVKVVDARQLGHAQAATSTSLTSAPSTCSITT